MESFAGDGTRAAEGPAHTSQAAAAPSTEGAQQCHPHFSPLLKVTRSRGSEEGMWRMGTTIRTFTESNEGVDSTNASQGPKGSFGAQAQQSEKAVPARGTPA